MAKLSLTTTARSSRRPNRRPARRGTRIQVVATRPKSSRPPRSSRARGRRGLASRYNQLQLDALDCYVATLTNPWAVGPCRIGFGTLVPTQLYTGYIRTRLTASADGTLAFAMVPSLVSTIQYANTGAGSSSWNTPISCTNVVPIQASCGAARVVSAGIKVMPLIPATAVPGMAFAGTIPTTTVGTVTAFTPNQLSQFPGLKQGRAITGCSAISEPIDPDSFNMWSSVVNGFGNNTLFVNSCPVVVLLSLPASCDVWIEAVVNIEGILQANSASAAITNPSISTESQKTLSDYFPSIESVWNFAKAYIPSAGTVNEGFTTAAHTVTGAMHAARTLRTARNTFFPPVPLDAYANTMARIEEVPD
jgi:hypothetical protein